MMAAPLASWKHIVNESRAEEVITEKMRWRRNWVLNPTHAHARTHIHRYTSTDRVTALRAAGSSSELFCILFFLGQAAWVTTQPLTPLTRRRKASYLRTTCRESDTQRVASEEGFQRTDTTRRSVTFFIWQCQTRRDNVCTRTHTLTHTHIDRRADRSRVQ